MVEKVVIVRGFVICAYTPLSSGFWRNVVVEKVITGRQKLFFKTNPAVFFSAGLLFVALVGATPQKARQGNGFIRSISTREIFWTRTRFYELIFQRGPEMRTFFADVSEYYLLSSVLVMVS